MVKLKNCVQLSLLPVSMCLSVVWDRQLALPRRKQLLCCVANLCTLCALPLHLQCRTPTHAGQVLSLQGPTCPDPRPSKPAPWCLYLAVLGVLWVPKVLPTTAARLGTPEARGGHLFFCCRDFSQSRLC